MAVRALGRSRPRGPRRRCLAGSGNLRVEPPCRHRGPFATRAAEVAALALVYALLLPPKLERSIPHRRSLPDPRLSIREREQTFSSEAQRQTPLLLALQLVSQAYAGPIRRKTVRAYVDRWASRRTWIDQSATLLPVTHHLGGLPPTVGADTVRIRFHNVGPIHAQEREPCLNRMTR